MNAGSFFTKREVELRKFQRSVGRLCIVSSNQKSTSARMELGRKNDAIFVKMA